jgi:2',3'-cyclic-nucleotide 2'-phosphodiesterase (5'-nucleotidase family)
MIPNVGYEKDVRVQRVIDQYMHKLEELKTVPLANVESFLESKTEGVRARETSMGNLLADAVRQRVNTGTVEFLELSLSK